MTLTELAKISGIIILCAAPIGSFAVAQSKIADLELELKDQNESIDENEKLIQQLQTNILVRQNQESLKLEQLKGDVKLVLRLLEKIERNQ